MVNKYCDPAFCEYCIYIGEGDFLCDIYQEIVLEEFTPTANYMICMDESPE